MVSKTELSSKLSFREVNHWFMVKKFVLQQHITKRLFSSLMHIFTFSSFLATTCEPPHDKTNKMSVCPAKTQISVGIRVTQISVGIRPVWSESSLSAWRKLGSLATHWVQVKTRIRLGWCPGWSESSLGAQPHCWFCHVAAHFATK